MICRYKPTLEQNVGQQLLGFQLTEKDIIWAHKERQVADARTHRVLSVLDWGQNEVPPTVLVEVHWLVEARNSQQKLPIRAFKRCHFGGASGVQTLERNKHSVHVFVNHGIYRIVPLALI